VEVSIVPETPESAYTALKAHVADPVRAHFPALDFTVHLKLDFTAEPLTRAVGEAAG